ncbi:type VII secretion integral membrane protein EccD [Nocardia sp. NPDC051787]|uniref:type VII secretion integral membrane protein EccD n=1 Tax=Nocardia sp. NPDC051787 TaxID=3155415 RepID=UPI00341F251F
MVAPLLIESPSDTARSAGPELCRVSVIGGNTQLDVGLPAAVPIVAFIGDLVALIESRNPDPAESEDSAAPQQTQHWTLARIGREPIAPNRTLTDAEVHDGELLVLRPVRTTVSPALFDDVIDAVSRLTTAEFHSWSPVAARWTGLAVAVVAVVAALGVLVVARPSGDGLAAPFLASGCGVAAFAAAWIAARRYLDELTATWLASAGLVLLGGSAALFVPGDLGSPHLLLGFSVTLVAAVLAYRLIATGATVFATAGTVALLGGPAAAVRLVWDPALPKISAGLVVAALTVISAVPRLASVLARLPVPPVPTAGGAIDPGDHEPRPAIEGIGAIGATALPSAAGLADRARAANCFQSGMLAGCTIIAVFGAVTAAEPFDVQRWQGIALLVVTAVILCLRGRSFSDLTQAATLIVGGCATLVLLTIALALGDPDTGLIAAALLLGFAGAAAGFGVIGPRIEITPVLRRANEIFEYLLIVAVIPLVLWIMDVYSAARNL